MAWCDACDKLWCEECFPCGAWRGDLEKRDGWEKARSAVEEAFEDDSWEALCSDCYEKISVHFE